MKIFPPDVDADGRLDAILRSFCCKNDWIGESEQVEGGPWLCDYTCWDSWWRGPEGWIFCATGGPC